MRLRSFKIENFGVIKLVEVTALSDVVVLAGPNGVGKTSINNALLGLAQNPNSSEQIWLEVGATDQSETTAWGKSTLNTKNPGDANALRQMLQRPQKRNRYRSSFLNFDSDRAVRAVQPFTFAWDIGDPFAEDMGWNIGFTPLFNRYNDVRHSLFRIVEGQRRQLADKAIALRGSGNASMDLDFPDVLAPFKDAFWQLLAPKKLIEVNIRDQQIWYEYNGQKLTVDTLSSGEKEVVNIVFDFILRNPENCIVVFDEPELHLHPELSYRLLQTLSRIGKNNQFIFSSHSPEIISASLENTVVFVTPPRETNYNQAIVVHRDDATHHALQTLGQSIGVISLGKKLVLIEGEEASLDKQTYGAILKNRFPEFVLVPVGGKDTMRSFDDVRDNILNRTIWGVDFFLLCDRDAVSALGKTAISGSRSNKVVQLPRYHLENYFLDEDILARIFIEMEPLGSWLRDPALIREKLKEIGRSVIAYATALNVNATVREQVGNASIMPKGVAEVMHAQQLSELILARVAAERTRVTVGLNDRSIQDLITSEFERLTTAITTNDLSWKADLPGRIILHKFAAAANIQAGRLKQLYLGAAKSTDAFQEIIQIFEAFKTG